MHKYSRCVALTGAVFLIASILLPQKAVAQSPPDRIEQPDMRDRYIVSFRPSISGADREEGVRQCGATPLFDLGLIDAMSVRIPGVDIFAALQGNPAIVRVVPDRRIFSLQTGVGRDNSRGAETSEVV